MYALLLISGAITATAGVALFGSGISVQDHTFDPSIIEPGVVSIVGGFLLIGFGLAVKQLIRIEHALVLRPFGANINTERSPLLSAAESATAPAIPDSVTPAAELPQPAELSPLASATLTPAGREAERLREKFPSLLRLETSQVANETEVSQLPKVLPQGQDKTVENSNLAVVHHNYDAAKEQSRNDVAVGQTVKADRSKNFDALWPRRKQIGLDAQAIVEPINGAATHPEQVVASVTPTPISVLKSGMVDGMAYTLYSDGSIEAQLPQGTLRFGSIADLRSHIERHAS